MVILGQWGHEVSTQTMHYVLRMDRYAETNHSQSGPFLFASKSDRSLQDVKKGKTSLFFVKKKQL